MMKQRINYVHEYKRLHREKMQHEAHIDEMCDVIISHINRKKRTVETLTGVHLPRLLDILCTYYK